MKLSKKQIEAGSLYLFFTLIGVTTLGLTENKLLLIVAGCLLGSLLMIGAAAVVSAFGD